MRIDTGNHSRIKGKLRKGQQFMKKFLIKRLVMMLITLFLITLLTFILMHAVPGGPFTGEKQVSKAVLEALNEKYKLNDPLWKQFLDYVKGILRFDLGPSFKYQGKTVNDFIVNGLPYSARLGAVTLVFVLLASIPMGIISALRNGKWQDMLLMAAATIGVTIPSFVIATALIYTFSFKLGWTPVYGVDSWKGYILPMIAMGGWEVVQLDDGWTIETADGSPAAHYENTILITADGPVLTTLHAEETV